MHKNCLNNICFLFVLTHFRATLGIDVICMRANYNILEVQNLSKRFSERSVVDGVSLTVAKGERVAIMGPSGSGKTTLINCIGGIEAPTSGTINVAGERLDYRNSEQLSRLRKKTITHVFQFFHVLPHLSLIENIEFPLLLSNQPRKLRKQKVTELIREVGIEHRADAFPHECSGGEIQRAAIARALVVEPALILADEPTGNLDSENGNKVLDLIEELSIRHQTAIILVTHSEEATRICSRLIRFKDGKIGEDIAIGHQSNASMRKL